jgi:dienelactone hydrolase
MLILAIVLSLWGDLQPGPHAVGVRQSDHYDYSRIHRTARTLDGKPRTGERARPIRVTIWYPAEATSGAPMTFADYARGEEAGIAGLTRFIAPMNDEQRAKMFALQGRGVRDAKPAAGKYPVILYSLGSPSPVYATAEYLASHGYVVVQAPRLGATRGVPDDTGDAVDLDNKLRDVDFMLNVVSSFPNADTNNMGALGFSAGGRWALASAMKNPNVRAVVSIDSVMIYDERQTALWRAMPHFNFDAVRVPVLHLQSAAFAKRDDLKMWDALRYADRTYLVYDDPKLVHWDYQSLGYATALAGTRGDAAPNIAKAFHAWNRETLAFLDANLKGGTYKQPESAKRTAALPAPITTAEFLNAIIEDGVDDAIAAYRAAWKARGTPPVDEATLNVAGYNVLFGERPADGVKVLALNAEAWPQSANVWDSLADAYVAIGDRAKAKELALKANALLAQEKDLPPERRAGIQASIDQKLR